MEKIFWFYLLTDDDGIAALDEAAWLSELDAKLDAIVNVLHPVAVDSFCDCEKSFILLENWIFKASNEIKKLSSNFRHNGRTQWKTIQK